MNLYLIRHGRQNSRLCNVDVELSEIGRRQAELLKERLKNYKLDVIYSSHLLRAVQTAEIINDRKLPHFIKKELQEIDFGELTGNTDQYNKEKYGEFLKNRASLTDDTAFPKGECGEDVWRRVWPILEEMIESGKKEIAAVVHGGTIRSILAGILGISQEKKLLFGICLENCSITQITYHEEIKRFTIERFNDFAHLEREKELLRGQWK